MITTRLHDSSPLKGISFTAGGPKNDPSQVFVLPESVCCCCLGFPWWPRTKRSAVRRLQQTQCLRRGVSCPGPKPAGQRQGRTRSSTAWRGGRAAPPDPPHPPPAEWLFLRPFKSSQSRLHVSSLGSKTRPQQNPAYRQPARRFLHFNRLSTDERRVRQRAAGPPGLHVASPQTVGASPTASYYEVLQERNRTNSSSVNIPAVGVSLTLCSGDHRPRDNYPRLEFQTVL